MSSASPAASDRPIMVVLDDAADAATEGAANASSHSSAAPTPTAASVLNAGGGGGGGGGGDAGGGGGGEPFGFDSTQAAPASPSGSPPPSGRSTGPGGELPRELAVKATAGSVSLPMSPLLAAPEGSTPAPYLLGGAEAEAGPAAEAMAPPGSAPPRAPRRVRKKSSNISASEKAEAVEASAAILAAARLREEEASGQIVNERVFPVVPPPPGLNGSPGRRRQLSRSRSQSSGIHVADDAPPSAAAANGGDAQSPHGARRKRKRRKSSRRRTLSYGPGTGAEHSPTAATPSPSATPTRASRRGSPRLSRASSHGSLHSNGRGRHSETISLQSSPPSSGAHSPAASRAGEVVPPWIEASPSPAAPHRRVDSGAGSAGGSLAPPGGGGGGGGFSDDDDDDNEEEDDDEAFLTPRASDGAAQAVGADPATPPPPPDGGAAVPLAAGLPGSGSRESAAATAAALAHQKRGRAPGSWSSSHPNVLAPVRGSRARAGSPEPPRSPLFDVDADELTPRAAARAAAAALLGQGPSGGNAESADAADGALTARAPAAAHARDGGQRRSHSLFIGSGANTVGDPRWNLRWQDEFGGGRMRHRMLPQIEQTQEARRKLEQAIIKFNLKPSAGVRLATESGVVEDTPDGIADFLHTAEGLSKGQIGQYLGGASPHHIAVLFAYVNRLDMRGRSFVDALRHFLSGFRLPGEAQQIDRMMEKFAERYCRDNPDVFETQDAPYLLAYALIMLNTDAHSSKVKHKMTKAQFLRNCRGLTAEGITNAFLEECYRSIVEREIKVDYDYLEQLYARIQANEISSVKYTMRRRRSLSAVTLASQDCTSVADTVAEEKLHGGGAASARRNRRMSADSAIALAGDDGPSGSGLPPLVEEAFSRNPSSNSLASSTGSGAGAAGGADAPRSALEGAVPSAAPVPLSPEQSDRKLRVAVERTRAGRPSPGGSRSAAAASSDGDVDDADDDAPVFDFRRLAHLGKLSGGNVFTKYGRRGDPHPRKVWLSDDTTRLYWQDVEQSRKPKHVRTSDILDVRVGRDTTQVFQRAAGEIHATKDALCFSVVTRERTLDLEADRADEVSAWVDFLTQVVEDNVIRNDAQNIAAQRVRREREIVGAVEEWKRFMFPRWADVQAGRGGSRVLARFRRVWLRGIPPSVRCRAWPRAIGNVLEVSPELFEAFLNMARLNQRQLQEEDAAGGVLPSTAFLGLRESAALLQRDLPQTFPELGFFHSGGPHLMQDSLREVLQAYMFFRPDIGYMTGMSHVACVLLLYTEVYDAFVCLCNLMHSHYFLAFARMDMDQLRWRFEHFDAALARHLPDLHAHFEHLRLPPEAYLVDWCLALYAKALPLDVASRLWDVYLLDGETVVYRAALAILGYHERQLLRSSLDDCLSLLRSADQYRDVPIDEERFWRLLHEAEDVLDAAEFDRLLETNSVRGGEHLTQPLRVRSRR